LLLTLDLFYLEFQQLLRLAPLPEPKQCDKKLFLKSPVYISEDTDLQTSCNCSYFLGHHFRCAYLHDEVPRRCTPETMKDLFWTNLV